MICLILLVNCCFNSAGVAASIVSSQSSSPGDAHEPILALAAAAYDSPQTCRVESSD